MNAHRQVQALSMQVCVCTFFRPRPQMMVWKVAVRCQRVVTRICDGSHDFLACLLTNSVATHMQFFEQVIGEPVDQPQKEFLSMLQQLPGMVWFIIRALTSRFCLCCVLTASVCACSMCAHLCSCLTARQATNYGCDARAASRV